MAIRVLPHQIPKVWENINYVVSKVDNFPDGYLQMYLNKLLQTLLDDKAQCFVRLGSDRQMTALAITQLSQNEVTGKKSLQVRYLYSFEPASVDEWRDGMSLIVHLAKSRGCSEIIARTSSERLSNIMVSIGFSEQYKWFAMEV